ncbi:MAG: acetylornithine/N-succinyldiaminopimelate aminotransferase [Thermotogaceae bacterium]|nr:acetylornithine/N-succinyldiaminopimelate aminotransferase [Thermotogaceae bacterium]
MSEYLSKVYNPFPVEVQEALGVYIFTKSGERYFDTFSGIGVLAFGHSDPDIKNAIIEKVKRHAHISNFFIDENAPKVAQKLVEKTKRNKGKVFFANSGAEANEAAIKAVKKLKKGLLVSFVKNFHGRTIGALSITGFPRLREPFVPLLGDVVFLPHNDVNTFKNFMENEQREIAAVFVECIHGSGGLNVIDAELVELINEYKNKKNYLIVADEVQAGLGRTGEFFAFQNFSLKPDIVTVAKSLGGGLPLGAAIFLDEVSDVFSPGDHGSTFAPNPVALAAASIVLDKIDESLLKEVKEKGNYIKKKLQELNKKIVEIRGLGLMIGVKVNVDGQKLRQKAFENGLLLNVLSENVVRFLPPLNISYSEIEEMLELFNKSLMEVE